jgi:uncharacterized RDD family membrane protein YckC
MYSGEQQFAQCKSQFEDTCMTIYGGFWIRFGAYLIDAIIVGVAGAIVGGIVGVAIGTGFAGSGTDSDAAATAELIGNGIGFILNWLYYALMESSSSRATVGKLAVGIVVTDEAGHQLTFARATGRYFAKILSALILLVGFLMVGWTERKQGLHDMIAGTLVTKKGTMGDERQQASVFE